MNLRTFMFMSFIIDPNINQNCNADNRKNRISDKKTVHFYSSLSKRIPNNNNAKTITADVTNNQTLNFFSSIICTKTRPVRNILLASYEYFAKLSRCLRFMSIYNISYANIVRRICEFQRTASITNSQCNLTNIIF